MRNIREIIAELEAADRKRYGNPGERLSDLVDWGTTDKPAQDVEEEDERSEAEDSVLENELQEADGVSPSDPDEDVPAEETVTTPDAIDPDDPVADPLELHDVEELQRDVVEESVSNVEENDEAGPASEPDDVADPEISDVLPEDDRTPNEVEDSPEQNDPADEQLDPVDDFQPDEPESPELDADTPSDQDVVDEPDVSEPESQESPDIADAEAPQQTSPSLRVYEPDEEDSPDISTEDTPEIAQVEQQAPDEDDVEMPDIGDLTEPSVSVASLGSQSQPSVEKAGFQGYVEPPALTEMELQQKEIDESSVTLEDRAEKQYAWGQQISENLAADLAQEITPMFDQLTAHTTNTVHNYVQEQLLLNTLLRARS